MSQTLYFNGKIITVNDAQPFAEAVLVDGETIKAVGNLAEALAQAEKDAARIDLAGKTMVPGFIDGHSHICTSRMFPRFDAPPTGDIDSVEKLVEAGREYLKENPVTGDNWLVGMGYDQHAFPDGKHPTKEDLDKISTEVPIVMMHSSGHIGCCNSKVFEVCGITKDTPNPAGGIFVKDPATGELTGMVEEAALTVELLGKNMPLPDANFMVAAIERAEKLYLSEGITTAQDGSFAMNYIPLIQSMHKAGRSKIDIYGYPQVDMIGDNADKIPRSTEARYVDGIKVAGVKYFLDGSPQAKTAWLSKPYYIPPEGESVDYCGYPVHPNDDDVCNVYKQALNNGWQILCHSNGDAAIEQFITQYARAQKETGITDQLRPVVIHCQTVREDQLDRMKEIGLLPSFFHDHVYLYGDLHLDSVLGPERGRRISPLTSAVKRGMSFTMHQDTPVIPPDMIKTLHHAVNRKTRSGRDIGPEFAVDPMEALRALTIYGAYQIFEEDSKGSIEPGKIADLVILDKSPLEVPKETIWDIKVLSTIKRGEVVYSAE